MNYLTFIKLVKWMNETGKLTLTDGDIQKHANSLWVSYRNCKENGTLTDNLKGLCHDLYSDMDYMDYMDYPPFMRGIETFEQLDYVLKTFVEYIKE